MNLRISEGQLRFRVTNEELEVLQKTSALTLTTPVGNYAIQCEKQETPLRLSMTYNTWTLHVDDSALKQLVSRLPAREGMVQDVVIEGTDLKLMLEVDVRRKKAA